MIDDKLILIKSITMFYCESMVSDTMPRRSTRLIQDVLNRIGIPLSTGSMDIERQSILGLKDTLSWLINNDDGTAVDSVSLLQRLRINLADDSSSYEACEAINRYSELDKEKLEEVLVSIDRELVQLISRLKVQDIIKKAYRDLLFSEKEINVSNYVNSLSSDLLENGYGNSDKDQSYIVEMFDTTSPDRLKDLLSRAVEEEGAYNGFRSGWQDFNRMFGEQGVIKRGWFGLVGALTGNYKSGLCSDLFRDFCLYNKPVLIDPTKKPLIIHITAENTATYEVLRLYIGLKEAETGEPVNKANINYDEAADYINKRLTANGFNIAMLRVDPAKINYTKLVELILTYEQDGYEVQCIFFDYLALIDKSDLGKQSMIGEDVRLLIQRVRTFTNVRNITFITPHQLSGEAMGLKVRGVKNFVKEVAGKNMWDGSKRIVNEVDFEIYVDKVVAENKTWLAIQLGKLRILKPPPENEKHFYLPFSDVGYILSDLDGPKRSVRQIRSDHADVDVDWG